MVEKNRVPTGSQPEMSRSIQQPGAASPGEEGVYEIKVRGYLANHWSEWLGDLTIRHDDQGNTLLAGSIADQAALHGVLAQIRNLGLSLLSLTRTDKGD